MGWCDSPAYICAASETARDVAETFAAQPEGSLAEHPLEGMLLRPQDWPELEIEQTSDNITKLLEVYLDDFIQLAQMTDPHKLRHLSRAVLHGIHSVSPPNASHRARRGGPRLPKETRTRPRAMGVTQRDLRMGFSMEHGVVLNCPPTR
jgi:hypothetical protein